MLVSIFVHDIDLFLGENNGLIGPGFDDESRFQSHLTVKADKQASKSLLHLTN